MPSKAFYMPSKVLLNATERHPFLLESVSVHASVAVPLALWHSH